jgi:hypothetical protein
MKRTLIALLLLSFPGLASAQWSYWRGEVSSDWERVDPVRGTDLSWPSDSVRPDRAHIVIVPQRPPRAISESDRRFWRPVYTLGDAAPDTAP